MTEWQTASADKIRRAVGESLGYLLRKPEIDRWAVFTPDFKCLMRSTFFVGCDTTLPSDELTERAYLDAVKDGLPDWPNDANAALALPLEVGRIWVIDPPSAQSPHWHDVYIKSYDHWFSEYRTISEAGHENLATAVCIAWLYSQNTSIILEFNKLLQEGTKALSDQPTIPHDLNRTLDKTTVRIEGLGRQFDEAAAKLTDAIQQSIQDWVDSFRPKEDLFWTGQLALCYALGISDADIERLRQAVSKAAEMSTSTFQHIWDSEVAYPLVTGKSPQRILENLEKYSLGNNKG